MTSKIWKLSLAAGIVSGIVVASIMTSLDWRLNPGGIFHDNLGTDWSVVAETAMSWFLPVFAAATVVTALTIMLVMRLK